MMPQKKTKRRELHVNQGHRISYHRMKRVNRHRARRRLRDLDTTLAAARSQYIY